MFLIPCILTKLINLFTLVTREVSKINLHNNQNYKMSFYRLFVNLGIETLALELELELILLT